MCVIVGFTQKTRGREEVLACLDRAYTRGPDMARVAETASGWLGFRRLSIMGLDERGMQPFALGPDQVVCNGELYGWRRQRAELEQRGYTFRSGSDCELLLPMYREYGLDMFARLDAEFALILYDGEADEYVAARDPIGIRPLFYGCDPDGGILFASEAKQLVGLCEQILPFPPGHYWYRGRFVRYADPARPGLSRSDDMDTVCQNIHDKLIAAVDKRLDADAPLGFLLSGGLDSSLVCAIAARLLGNRRHRSEVRSEGGAVHRGGPHGGDHHQGRRDSRSAQSGGRPGHLGHYHHPGQRRHVPVLQGHPRGYRHPGAPHRGDLRRALRL